MTKIKPTVLAYYFPNWHVDPRNEAWHGEGWTEWEVLKHATPRFEGHKQPKVPLWGYEDESDPKVMAKKIDAAVDHGVDGFIFDWYWFNDGGYRLKCIDEGFLGAENCEKAKFAVMWCNHDPIYVHPAGKVTGAMPLLSGDLTVQGFMEGSQYCIDHYFGKSNYLRNSEGKLYFGFYLTRRLIDNFGGPEATRMISEGFRNRVRKAGHGEVDMNAILESTPGFRTDYEKANEIMKYVGFDSFSSHGLKVEDDLPFPHRDYRTTMKANIAMFDEFTGKSQLPYNINIYHGRDSSPRTIQSETYGDYGFPFDRIVNNITPELFGELCEKAKEFYYEKSTGEYITIYSWNEWTEGGCLEPDVEYEYGYLEAIKKAFKAD